MSTLSTFAPAAALRATLASLACALVVLAPGAPASAQGADGNAPPPAVVTQTVQVQSINPPQSFVGRLEAVRVADLVARSAGFLEEIHFQEGADIEAGTLLYSIEDREYRARVQLAEANVASAEAAAREAEMAFERTSELSERGTLAQAALDEATAARDTAAAQVQGAEAELVRAELDLSYTEIRAPISGRIGRTSFTEGDFIDLSSGTLARLIQMDPIRVVFSISERDLVTARLEARGQSQSQVNASFTPRIVLPDGTEYPQVGKIDFISNEVDASTGTVAVRALFDNPEGLLLHGQFVDLRVTRTEEEQSPVVPISAVQRDRQGAFVLGLGEGDVVERIDITPGQRLETVWTVTDGLEGGEVIVVQGLQKARVGQPVTPEERSPEVAE